MVSWTTEPPPLNPGPGVATWGTGLGFWELPFCSLTEVVGSGGPGLGLADGKRDRILHT